MNLTVRQAESKDFPAIQSFLHEAFGASALFKAAQRWRWQFMDNPYRSASADWIPVWIALCGDKVVGQIAVQPASVKHGPSPARSSCAAH